MLKCIRSIFKRIEKLEKKLSREYFGSYKGFLLVFVGILIIAGFGAYLKDHFHNDILFRFAVVLMGSYMYLLIPVAFYREGTLKTYIVWGKKEKLSEIIKRFSFGSYFKILCAFSILLIFPLLGIPFLLSLIGINLIDSYISEHVTYFLYANTVFVSIWWFTYHIVYTLVSLQKIRAKVAQYIAIGSTLTLLFNAQKIEDASLLMSCLLVSYFWIQYIIELRAEEIETLKHTPENVGIR